MEGLISFTKRLEHHAELAVMSMEEPMLLLSESKLRDFFGDKMMRDRTFMGIPVIPCSHFEENQFLFFDDYKSIKGRLL